MAAKSSPPRGQKKVQNDPACRVFVCLFVCFVALRPKSTAVVMGERLVHLTTVFPGQT